MVDGHGQCFTPSLFPRIDTDTLPFYKGQLFFLTELSYMKRMASIIINLS